MATMITVADKFFNLRNGIEVPGPDQRVSARFVAIKNFVGADIPVTVDGVSIGGINEIVALTAADGSWSMSLPAGDVGYQHETLHAEHLTGSYSGEQLIATFTPAGDSLSHLAAGDLTITVYFLV